MRFDDGKYSGREKGREIQKGIGGSGLGAPGSVRKRSGLDSPYQPRSLQAAQKMSQTGHAAH